MKKLKVYAAIGHFRESKNVTCVALTNTTKKAFIQDCGGNAFVPYIVLTESTLGKFLSCNDDMDIFNQVKKMTSNYRVWNIVADYIEQCLDIVQEKMEAEKKRRMKHE